MRRGKVKIDVLQTMERLAHEKGRPPFRAEITAALTSDPLPGTLTRTLERLEKDGFLQKISKGEYIQLKTLEGRPLEWSMRVGPVPIEPREDRAA